MANSTTGPRWQAQEVKSPLLPNAVPVIAALDMPYIAGGHRLQTLSLYAPRTTRNEALVGQVMGALPEHALSLPRIHVHIHGGAWRDPFLTSKSIEPTAAYAFRNDGLDMIISINYTLSPFPTHPTSPYPGKDYDPAREARHPQHVSDVLHAFDFLRKRGLSDGSYLLSGHSAGACLVFQSILKSPAWWKQDIARPPTPAAIIGLNGLYDLPELVHGLGPKHKKLSAEYHQFQSIAFGDESNWADYSPARFDVEEMSMRVASGEVPTLVLLDQSVEDQLVPENQRQRLELQLSLVDGLEVVKGMRCVGKHAAPWEQGDMIWDTIKDVLAILGQRLETAAV